MGNKRIQAEQELCNVLNKNLIKSPIKKSNFLDWASNINETTTQEIDNNKKVTECRALIDSVYNEGYSKGISQHSMCLSSIPNQVVSLPGTIGSLFTTKKEGVNLKRPVFILPPYIEEKDYTCDEKFNLFNSVFLPKQKTLSEYFDLVGIKENGDILDFSKMNYGYDIKLGSFNIENIKILLGKLQRFENCSILQQIKKIYLLNHNFQKQHLDLIPFIFLKFTNVDEIRFGISNTVESQDINCGLSFNCDIKNDENGRYILATRNISKGGKKRRSKKQKSRKNRKYRKTTRKL